MALTDKELFVHIATSIQFALSLGDLDKETKTRILIKLVEKFCPGLTYTEWRDVFFAVEALKRPLAKELIKVVERKDYAKIADQHLKVFKYSPEEYQKRMKNINIDIEEIKRRMEEWLIGTKNHDLLG